MLAAYNTPSSMHALTHFFRELHAACKSSIVAIIARQALVWLFLGVLLLAWAGLFGAFSLA